MATGIPEQQAIGRLVTDAVAAVLDERYQSTSDPTEHGFLDSLTARLATQFHNVPGYDAAEFHARASKGKLASEAVAAAKLKSKSDPAAAIGPPAGYDAAAEHAKLVAASKAAHE